MLDQSNPDSGLGYWSRYQGLALEKTIETAIQVYRKIFYGFNTISW
jgi:hypothetical protein